MGTNTAGATLPSCPACANLDVSDASQFPCQHPWFLTCWALRPDAPVCGAGLRRCSAFGAPSVAISGGGGGGGGVRAQDSKCTGCVVGTTGPCKADSGHCWDYAPGEPLFFFAGMIFRVLEHICRVCGGI